MLGRMLQKEPLKQKNPSMLFSTSFLKRQKKMKTAESVLLLSRRSSLFKLPENRLPTFFFFSEELSSSYNYSAATSLKEEEEKPAAAAVERGRKKGKGKWLKLPPYSSSMDPSLVGKAISSRRLVTDSNTASTALKWILHCCPHLPRSLVQKLFRLRQVESQLTQMGFFSFF